MVILFPQGRNNNTPEFFLTMQGTEKAWGTKYSERKLFIDCADGALTGIFVLLVEQTNLYRHQYLDKHLRPSHHTDITLSYLRTLFTIAL
jgi:hypothetical protein